MLYFVQVAIDEQLRMRMSADELKSYHDSAAARQLANRIIKDDAFSVEVLVPKSQEEADQYGVPWRPMYSYRRYTIGVAPKPANEELDRQRQAHREEGFRAALKAMQAHWSDRDGLSILLRDIPNKMAHYIEEAAREHV